MRSSMRRIIASLLPAPGRTSWPWVITGADCGFATFAFVNNAVAPSLVWAKLAVLAEGSRVATTRLWG